MAAETKAKIVFLFMVVSLTVAIHYGWILELLFGSSHWLHALHGRFCYIPIVIAASWFGLRGGLYMATVISALVLPHIMETAATSTNELSSELVEIVFYYAIAILTGSLIARELRIRREQEQTQLQLERSHKLSMVGQMAASVAHEIKNPLASIKGAVEILKDETTSSSAREEFTGIVSKEIKRIDGTIGEFLAFARPRKTKLEKLNLSSALQSSLKQMETHAARNEVRIQPMIEEDVVVCGDEEKIHQVVLNLLLNAIEASEAGCTIDVNLTQSSSGDVSLVVRDCGKGIDKSECERIFEPFYTTKSSGTGLGLAIVKAIVENHGGELTVDSNPGQGTSMKITFPTYREKRCR